MKLLENCSTISVAKLNESLTVYLLVVNGYKIGTEYFANSVLCHENKKYILELKQSLLKMRDRQRSMDRNVISPLLYLFVTLFAALCGLL